MFDFWEKVFLASMAIVFGTIALSIVLYMPYRLYAESECLKQGYPKASVTYDYEAYCMNLDGNIVIKVEKLK